MDEPRSSAPRSVLGEERGEAGADASVRARATSLRRRLNALYFGTSRTAFRFQAAILVVDLILIGFFMVAPFLERGSVFLAIDYGVAFILAADLCARAWAYGDVAAWLRRPIVWADLAVLASLLVPIHTANLGFLRILRLYSFVNGRALWRVLGHGRWANTDVAETVKAASNLLVFVFMMASLVHTVFAARLPSISSYVDSLYFTVTSLTTTGYGDIVLPGWEGRLLSIVIMLGGVSLFLRLVQVTMRGGKVRHLCTSCGLLRHEPDAVCCKACGTRLRIEHDNE